MCHIFENGLHLLCSHRPIIARLAHLSNCRNPKLEKRRCCSTRKDQSIKQHTLCVNGWMHAFVDAYNCGTNAIQGSIRCRRKQAVVNTDIYSRKESEIGTFVFSVNDFYLRCVMDHIFASNFDFIQQSQSQMLGSNFSKQCAEKV